MDPPELWKFRDGPYLETSPHTESGFYLFRPLLALAYSELQFRESRIIEFILEIRKT